MTLRDDLHSWLSRQPLWQQDLAKRLVSRPQLDGSAYDEALRVVKCAHKALRDGETAPAPEALALSDLPASATTGAPRLVAFGRLRGVGSVSSEYELSFAPDGLTVIYGQNAVGKTTYVRALKRVCRAVDCEAEVRGNVFAPRTSGYRGPTAKVELALSGEVRAQQLDLATPPDLGLDALSVFDAQCAELYVDEQNAVAFVPSELRLLARLAATQDRMRRDLDRGAHALGRREPSFPELAADTEVGRAVGRLSATTNLESVRALATLDQTQLSRRTELRSVLASAEARSARSDAAVARQDAREADTLANRMRELAGRVAEPARDALRAHANRTAIAEAAAELAAQEFSSLPVAGVGGGPWRQLWQAARAFAEQSTTAFPPPAGQPCPLCLQEISPDAASRLSHFEQHVLSSVQTGARQSRAALDAALEPLDARHVEGCREQLLAGLHEREPDLASAIESYLEGVSARMEALRADPAGAHVLPLLLDPVEQLDAWAKSRGAHAERLLAADDPEREKELRAELTEIDAREQLAARVPDVEAWVGELALIAALRKAHTSLATNRITTKQRQLSEDAVTGALDAKLREELSNLDCAIPVALDPQTQVGETHVALRLAGAYGTPKISDIASEGEQRALALSFFLAEVAMSEGDGGIVVDDPVSSLDDERRDYIAKRLVAESNNRQVIVFTHDLPFMLDLLDRAEHAQLQPHVQGVWRLGADVGRVDDHPPFKAMKLKQRIGVLTQEVEQWDKQDPVQDLDQAWRRVCDFYARLRITWERGVEERLFKGVVTRFQREVKTLSLDDVVVTPDMIALVKEGMTRCSMFVHDEPSGTSTSLPDRARLSQDLDKLREFVMLTK